MAGLGGLFLVISTGATSYGAKLSLSIGGILSIQPSEFVKIIFVFLIASMLSKDTSFKNVVVTTLAAVLHVGVLVVSKDLGAALIFFVVYIAMLYVATKNPGYAILGLGVGVMGALAGYRLFAHVRTRIIAWKNPFDPSIVEGAGWQVAQSLFAICSGGWFGTGLFLGYPSSIPVVEEDFIFAAIAEELGGLFSIFLILICISCFLLILNIAMQIKDPFYKLVALGLGTCYMIQVFLMIGGVIKFIPSTGITLPFVSYGGSSLLSSFILFSIILGMYTTQKK